MKQSAFLLTVIVVVFCFSAVATDELALTVTGSSLVKNQVLVKVSMEGKRSELQCQTADSFCAQPSAGDYRMVRAAKVDAVYQDCTNVVLYKLEGGARQKVGVYCWLGSGDCYMISCPPVPVENPPARAQESDALWDITLQNCSGKYRVTVAGQGDYSTLDITHTDQSGKRTVIAHDKRQLWNFLYAWPISVIPRGVVAVWECGTGVCTTVFALTPNASKPVFDEWSESAPEFIRTDVGEAMLFYTGKRFLRQPSGLWEPRKAAIYLWRDDRYQLATTVPYEQRFNALAKMRRSTARQVASSPCAN